MRADRVHQLLKQLYDDLRVGKVSFEPAPRALGFYGFYHVKNGPWRDIRDIWAGFQDPLSGPLLLFKPTENEKEDVTIRADEANDACASLIRALWFELNPQIQGIEGIARTVIEHNLKELRDGDEPHR